ncbi:MAG: transposase, partial [Tannerellaceae bacterium]|nr:transposase [Tannerellaceae bacterium]
MAFKGLFPGYHDGKSFYALDFSLHGEKGKNEKRPYGMTKKEIKHRYSKKRDKKSFGEKRVEEYFMSKIESLLSMIHLAIREGIRFDYLLVDSWFTCFEIVRFTTTRRIDCHLLGMIKMGKTKYNFNGISLTSKEIVDVLRRKKKTKRSKRLNCRYGEAIVEMKGIEVKLFFCKTSRKGNWNGLLSTNVQLDFEEAYRIYSTRWTIEVYFKESKQYLGLSKCQSQDFDAQIASTSICMLQYNLLS